MTPCACLISPPPTRPPGRPSGCLDHRSKRDGLQVLRNIGLAILAGSPPPRRPMTTAEIAGLAELPESTVRSALAAGRAILESLGGSR